MNGMPATVKRSIEILGLLGLGTIIVLGQSVIMPLVMAFFVSLLLLPVMRWLIRHRVPEIIAIVLCILLVLLLVAGIATFLSLQVAGFVKDYDTIKENLTTHWNSLSDWISSKTHLTVNQQMSMIKSQASNMSHNVSGYFQGAFSSVSNIFVFLGLLPIYIFLILFYRNLLVRFVYLWFDESNHSRVAAAVRETEVIVKYYLLGLLIQIGYITVLLGGILLIWGIKHAILIGIIFAILNLIPYLGALIGNVLGVLLTLTTSSDLWQVWAVLGTIAFVQFLDNNILMPRIVGSKVKVNALVSIVGIVVGGALAGIMGMFLSIPVMAVLKIVFDKSDKLKQWGYLLGDERPALSPISNRMYRIRVDMEERKDESIERETRKEDKDDN